MQVHADHRLRETFRDSNDSMRSSSPSPLQRQRRVLIPAGDQSFRDWEPAHKMMIPHGVRR